MKRYGNLYQRICSMDNLRLAHTNARRGKTWYKEVKEVDGDTGRYLSELHNSLVSKTYHTSEYEIFERRCDGKVRTIYKLPYYPDRICHWAIIQVVEPMLISKMVSCTYSALPQRGIHKCLNDVRKAVKDDHDGCQYCLKLDISKYYPSIPHDKLKAVYRSIFKDEDLLWLIYEIIDSTDSGVPIGNYLSQYSGNLYLSSIDHWLKESKGIKHYFRYMDDLVILHESKDYLHELFKELKIKLAELGLEVKSNWQIFPTYVRGLDFVGYRVFDGYTLLRKSTAKRYKSAMRDIAKHETKTDHDNRVTASYHGVLSHADCHRLESKYANYNRNNRT